MGKRIGERWEIIKALAPGGQGETFVVQDLSDPTAPNRVLKRLKNVNRSERFSREIEAIEALDHPNVLRIITHDTDGARPFLVSEYCELGSLEENSTAIKGMSLDDQLGLFESICEGVAAIHQSKIVHRDLKPGNVFLRDLETPVVGDFGICFLESDEDQRLTETLEVAGPRWYSAPELADGRASDVAPSADVYSLGKLLYWLLTGRVFDREKHRQPKWSLHNFLEPGDSNEHLPVLLDRMITESPTKRFADASQVLAETKTVRRLVRGGYASLKAVPQLCRYCGNGLYVQIANSITDIRNFGFDAVSGSRLHIFRCKECGHVLLFQNARWLKGEYDS